MAKKLKCHIQFSRLVYSKTGKHLSLQPIVRSFIHILNCFGIIPINTANKSEKRTTKEKKARNKSIHLRVLPILKPTSSPTLFQLSEEDISHSNTCTQTARILRLNDLVLFRSQICKPGFIQNWLVCKILFDILRQWVVILSQSVNSFERYCAHQPDGRT